MIAVAAVMISVVPLSAFPSVANAEIVQVKIAPEYRQTVARSMLPQLNSWRAGSNWYYSVSNTKLYKSALKALTYDYTLEQYAMQRAAEIAISFEHTRPKGDARTGLSGYMQFGENIAASTNVNAATPEYAMTMFKEEDKPYTGQGHRRMMLSVPAAWDAIGIACVYYKGCYYWVQSFGVTSKPNTTLTTAVNGNKTMTVDIETSRITSKSADLTNMNDWTASLSKGQTDYLPSVSLQVGLAETWPHAQADTTAVPNWTSSNTNVATVNSVTGTITGVNAGTTTTTMKEPVTGVSKSKTVSVTDPTAVTGVTLNKTTLPLKTGSSSTLTATVSPAAAANKNVTWSSSNTAVATVSSTGLVKGVKAGTATITAKTVSGGKTATCKVTVTDVAVTGVKLNNTSLTVGKGMTGTLKATVSPSNATNKKVTWSSSNTKVATVSSAGVVKGIKPGTATITAKTASGAKTATCKVTVVLYYTDANGKIQTTFTGLAKVDGGWKYFTKGVYDTTYEGLAKSPKTGKWYYVKKGVIDSSYTGMAKSPKNGKWYYVTKGVMDKTYNGMAKSPKNGKWYYMVKGLLDYSYTGLAQNPANGNWYYFTKSSLDKTFTGIAQKSDGLWYVVKGVVNKKYSGKVTYNGKTYKVTKGKAIAI